MKDFGSLKNHEPTEIIKNRGRNICGFNMGVHVKKKTTTTNNQSERFWTFEIL